MSLLDAFLYILLFFFIIFNLSMGFVHALGSVFGLVMGILVAKRYYLDLAGPITDILFGRAPAAQIVAFVVIFVIVARVTGLLFHYIHRFLRFIPLLPTLDRVLGAVLGFVEGALVIGIVLSLLLGVLPQGAALTQAIETSWIGGWLILIARVLLPLIPEALRHVNVS